MRRFVLMIQDLQPSLLGRLGRKVIRIDETDVLKFGNNALGQLSVFPEGGERKHEYLMGVLNKTKTSIGKRRLADWLRFPAVNRDTIIRRQRVTDFGLQGENAVKLRELLGDMGRDLERVFRVVETNGGGSGINYGFCTDMNECI